MSANADAIHSFLAAWNEIDLDRVMTHFTEDCVYHNIPVEPVSGTEAIRKVIDGFAGMAEEIRWDLHAITEGVDGAVWTERTDNFKIGGSWVSLRVMGIFEFRDGRICAWRDYFDMHQFSSQLPGAAG